MTCASSVFASYSGIYCRAHACVVSAHGRQVAAVAHLLHGYGINIVETDQFTDPFSSVYFQRLKVD